MRRKKEPAQQIRTVALHIGELTTHKKDALNLLRSTLLTHAQAAAELFFQPDPLAVKHDPKRLFTLSANYQKQQTGINKAYLQVVIQQVEQAAFEQEKRYFKRLLGRLRYIASEIPSEERKARKYYYVPVEIQEQVIQADFAKLSALPEQMELAALRELLHSTLYDGEANGFTLLQLAILKEIHTQALQRHRPLTIKNDEETNLSLPLDYRMLPVTDKNLVAKLSSQVHLLVDQQNTQYQFFLSLAPSAPRAERIQIPIILQAKVLQRLMQAGPAEVNSLTLVLGTDRVSVRLALAKPKTLPTTVPQHLVARDFGYVNTITLSVIRTEEELDYAKLAMIQAFTKKQAEQYLTTHALLAGKELVVERQRFRGRKFLEAIKQHCLTIDSLRSQIDVAYNKLEALKSEIANALNLPAEALLPNDNSHPKLRKLFQLLTRINKWKAKRRTIYHKIAGLRKS